MTCLGTDSAGLTHYEVTCPMPEFDMQSTTRNMEKIAGVFGCAWIAEKPDANEFHAISAALKHAVDHDA